MKRILIAAAIVTGFTAIAAERIGWSAKVAPEAFRTADLGLEKLNLGYRFKASGETGTFGQDAPWTRDGADAKRLSYMQFRVWNAERSWMAVDFLGHRVMEPTQMGFGFFTVPVYGAGTALPAGGSGTAPFTCTVGGGSKFVDLSEILLAGPDAIDGVFVSAVRGDGTPVRPGETARSGDLMTVRMPVISKPDSLKLFFKELSTDPKTLGSRLSIPVDTAPPRLEPSKEDPLLYTATFELPVLAKARTIGLGRFVAMIDYAGVDSRIWGPYYGVAPFAVEFAGGSTKGVPPEGFLAIDFGPDGQSAKDGCLNVSKSSTPEGFRWLSRPREFEDSKHRYLGPLTDDWAAIRNGETAEFAVKVPRKGKYRVVVGIWPQIPYCYRMGDFRPLEYDVSVNGGEVKSRRRTDELRDRFPLREVEATEDEDCYEKYLVKGTCNEELVFETEAEGELTVKVASPKAPAARVSCKKTPLNYVLVYPADDAKCAAFRDALEADRRARFHAFWADATSAVPDFRNALNAKTVPGEGLRLFARDNALDWVMPKTMPTVNEIGRPLVIRAARGERVSGGVLFNPSKDFAGVEFAVSGLPEKVHARVWKQMVYRFCHTWNGIHQLGVNHLLPVKPEDMKAGVSHGYLVRLDVDGDVRPGTYRGVFTAKAADGAKAELAVELEVYGCELPKLSDHLITMINGPCTRENMEFCRDELGATSFLIANTRPQWLRFDYDRDGNPTGLRSNIDYDSPLAKWAEAFRTYREVGFECPYPMFALMGVGYNEAQPFDSGKIKVNGFDAKYRRALRLTYGEIKKAAQAAGCPNVVFDMGGEMGHEAKKPADFTVENAIALYKAIHEEVPGSMLSYRCNCFTTVERFNPYLEVQGVRGKTSWKYADRITDRGRNKWIYTYSRENRFNNGISSWAHGARGNFREWLTFDHYEHYNDFLCQGACGMTAHYETIPGPGGRLWPTMRSEAFRASVFDRKFIRLLENAAKLPTAKPADARKAEKFLGLVRRIVYDHASDEGSGWSYGTHRGDGNNPWPGIRLDLMRDFCVRLAAAMSEGRESELPFVEACETDYTDFGLADGPLEPAGVAALAAFANEKKYDLSDPGKVAVELYDAKGTRLGSYAPGAKDRCLHPSFVIPAAALGPGRYVLKLIIAGKAVTAGDFHLL